MTEEELCRSSKILSPISDIRCLRIMIQHLTARTSACRKTESESILWHSEMILLQMSLNFRREPMIPKESSILLRRNLFPQSTISAMCILKPYVSIKQDMRQKSNGFGYEVRGIENIAGAIVCGEMGRERNLVVDKHKTNLTPTKHIIGEINRDGIRKLTPAECFAF